MGKLGKERKRKRAELGEVGEGLEDGAPTPTASYADAGSIEAHLRANLNAALHDAAAVVALTALAANLDAWHSKALKPARVALYPLIKAQQESNAWFEPSAAEGGAGSPAADVAALVRTADRYARGPGGMDAFRAAGAKAFRRALHPLVLDASRREGRAAPDHPAGLSGSISCAFRDRNWPAALRMLREMAVSNERPRLGALQRWVRDCDLVLHDGGPGQGHFGEGPAAGEGEGAGAAAPTPAQGAGMTSEDRADLALRLLDAVMRAGRSKEARTPQAPTLPTRAIFTRHPLFSVLPSTTGSAAAGAAAAGLDARALRTAARVVQHVEGKDRQPPGEDDLRVWATQAGAVPYDSPAPPLPSMHPVPNVPGAMLLADVLSHAECGRLIAAAEALGYARDGVDGIGAVVWLADDSLLAPLYERCRALMPQTLNGQQLAGLNARWRLFRYTPGAVYRPHIDGAWPGSGLDAAGGLLDDVFGDRYSRYTFLVYLNGGFDGGATSFFLPGAAEGSIELHAVQPHAGSVLLFPHGDAHGSLVHEGSAVAEGGVKYIIRSDVLYHQGPRGRGVHASSV
jgi:hypothetical protein